MPVPLHEIAEFLLANPAPTRRGSFFHVTLRGTLPAMADTLRVKTEKLETGGVIATVLLESVTDFDLTPLAGDLRDSLTIGKGKLGLDMSTVILLGSAGLGLLINLRKEAMAMKGKFVMYGLSEEMMGVLKATKLNTLLTIVKDRKDAITALS